MTAVVAASVLFTILLALEWLFWLSPFKPAIQRLAQRMGSWFYVAPPYYIARVLALCIVLCLWRLELWPIFAGGPNWCYSFALGAVVILLTYFFGLRTLLPNRRTLWQKARAWYQENPLSFAQYIGYLVVYPGSVEELLFRWFFTATLWPSLKWWTAVVSPLLNILWHLPVWVELVRMQGAENKNRWAVLIGIAGPATTFAVLLTVMAIITHNLIGPIMAHAFGDWCGQVLQRPDHCQSSEVAGREP